MRKLITLRVFQIAIIVLIALFIGYFYGTRSITLSWKNYQPIVAISSKSPPPGTTLDMRLFYEVLSKVNQDYYDKTQLDTRELLYGAINGMLSSLNDPYTSFFPPKQNSDFKTQLAGEFTGIGAELSMSADNRIMVVAPLDNTPAHKAGIAAGDIILEVDGRETVGWTVAKAVEKIRGAKGSTVILNVLHEGKNSPVEIKVVRDVIFIKSVDGWVKRFICQDKCSEDSNGLPIAYIRLSQFGDKTNDEWTSVVNSINTKIKEQNGLSGIILDVRNNPGGYLNDAVFISSEFLRNGVVVIQENSAKQQEALRVSRVGTLFDYPLIVLVNRGSASASEIVAGALRDHNRAKLLGDKSFGKGTIQQAVDVDDGASVHISVAKWLTPSGIDITEKGLEPDVPIEQGNDEEIDLQLEKAKEEVRKL